MAIKASAQPPRPPSVMFDSCFVKGAHVPDGINYKVIVDVTVSHPAFENPTTTANLKVSDSSTPRFVIYNLPLDTNGARRTGGTVTPAGPPTKTDPTFPLVVEVIVNNPALGINNVSLTLSGGSRARIVPATIESPFEVGGIDWVKITGGGNVNDRGVKTQFKPTPPTNRTGDFVEEFRVTEWVYGMSYKAYRVKTFQGTHVTPILNRLYQLESGFIRHKDMPLSTSEFTHMLSNDTWVTNFNSKFLKGTTPSHSTPSLPFYW